MSFWSLMQIVLNILFIAFFAMVWIRLNRPQKDDPRMSRGLQLLQSKISVLEDLSDRTEHQVVQLTALMEAKIKEIQQKVEQADLSVQRVQKSIERSMEVAQIFQDKIPHQEIIERQNTIKFVKAAKMAHQGFAPEEIARHVDLAMGEIDFIVKVNKDQLSFDESALPKWITAELSRDSLQDAIKNPAPNSDIFQRDMSQIFEVPKANMQALQKLGEQFREATKTFTEVPAPKVQNVEVAPKVHFQEATPKVQNVEVALQPAPQPKEMAGRVRELGVRPYEFAKIEIPKL